VPTPDNPARLRLIGGERTFKIGAGPEEVYPFYGSLFDRMAKEVRPLGAVTRHVAFQGLGPDHLYFLGIEVERIESVPDGMVAWELGDDTLSVHETRGGKLQVIRRQPITWQWWATPADGVRPVPRSSFLSEGGPVLHSLGKGGLGIGEFTLQPTTGGGESRAMWIAANAYLSPGQPYADGDEVRLAEYDPSWPKQFEAFAGWLRGQLGPAVRIEHYGSTAVEGLPAKPIIDVLLEAPSAAEARRQLAPLLDGPPWEYWWYDDAIIFIRRDGLMGRRTHHLHVAPAGHRLWEGLEFRDYLRSHPDEAARYAALKHELAAAHRTDRERYTLAKTDFIRQALAKTRGTA
jgi:GrpB-like predicted nucleotidyltransferase (UPF0157 family)